MRHDSRQQNERYARGHRDLNVPTETAEPESAKDLPAEGRDTNPADPKELTSWEDDHHVL